MQLLRGKRGGSSHRHLEIKHPCMSRIRYVLVLVISLLAAHNAPQVQCQSKTSVTEQGECHLGETGVCLHYSKGELANAESNSKCTIYLAPSTIPRAGLGIFTTIPKQKGEFIGQGDVFLPLFEMDWHNDKGKLQEDIGSFITYFNPFSDYVWTGDVMGMGDEVESSDVQAMCPGLDAAINCNLALINVGKALPVWDDVGLHRSRDPGAGALTPYHNGTTPVLYRNIPAGGELFKFYGDNWFKTRPDWFSTIPLSEDYPRAQQLLDTFGRLIGMAKQQTSTTATTSTTISAPAPTGNASSSFRLSVDMQRDLWDVVAYLPFTSRTLNALPKKLEDAWIAIQEELAALYQPYAVRSEAFLEEHGKCFDHIKPGRSGMVQAGRGAFAVRTLKKDSIISGSPLLHLPDYKVFNIFEFNHDPVVGKWVRSDKVIGQQVMLNYCFGHISSTILLCPYGAGVPYINHNQTLANVKVQWSKDGVTGQNDTWFNLTPPEMEWQYRPHLAMDYVALRDIEEGEELFMDYGDEFEAAWQKHVADWKPVANAKSYASAHDFNNRMSVAPLRTEREQEWDPYPSNLQVRCHSILADHNWRQRIPKYPPKNGMWPLNEKGYPCRILHRNYEEDADLYEVHVYEQYGNQKTGTQYSRSRVPRHAIAFSDKPYTTDMHLRNAFRYPIIIPDSIFPDAWRNTKAVHVDVKQ